MPGTSDDVDQLRGLLLDAEQRAASVPQLRGRIGQLEHELSKARAEAHSAREETQRVDRRLMESQQVLVDVMTSPSWQATKPLRAAKRLLHDARP